MSWHLSQSTTDVIIGGLIAATGGFLAVAYGRWRDWVGDKQRFKAAVLAVLDELGANEVNIEHLLAAPIAQLELYDSTFRSVELTLADRLKPDDRKLVAAEAYAPLRSRWVAETHTSHMDWTALKGVNLIQPDKAALAVALQSVKAARSALAKYVPRKQIAPLRHGSHAG